MKTKNLTLTETLEQLKVWIEDCQFDLSSDWIEEEDKREMTQQLQNLLIAKANLEIIQNTGGQILKSVITN
tara:strand:- start:1952 stop:2164 length:213 start_codon:yes stop_codon:yes gene_type:complete